MQLLLERLKIPVLTVVISLLAFFLLVKLFGPIPFSVTSVISNKGNLFTVDGVGEVSGAPKNAQFIIGVNKTGTTVEATQQEVNVAVNKITDALKKLGIAEKDIKTTDYSVNPNIDYASGKQTTTGYSVSATTTVTLQDASKANAALDSATSNGANVISGVTFTLSDSDKEALQDEARGKAIENAKEQAQKISKQAGIRLGRLENIYITPSNGPIMYDKMSVAGNEPREATAPTELQPGENKVTVNVTLSYETL